jgi:hypothetical protein
MSIESKIRSVFHNPFFQCLDYVPVASTITNLAQIIHKKFYTPSLHTLQLDAHRIEWWERESNGYGRKAVLLIPVFGNALVAFYAIRERINERKLATNDASAKDFLKQISEIIETKIFLSPPTQKEISTLTTIMAKGSPENRIEAAKLVAEILSKFGDYFRKTIIPIDCTTTAFKLLISNEHAFLSQKFTHACTNLHESTQKAITKLLVDNLHANNGDSSVGSALCLMQVPFLHYINPVIQNMQISEKELNQALVLCLKNVKIPAVLNTLHFVYTNMPLSQRKEAKRIVN